MTSTLRALEPHLPSPLVGPRALARLRRLMRALPASLSDCWYLECRLDGDERVDLILRVGPEGREILAGSSPLAPGEELASAPHWSRLREWCREWSDPRSRLHPGVRRIWLEFDLDDAAPPGGLAAPGVFMEWRRDPAGAVAPGELAWRMEAAAELLFRGDAPQPVRDRLEACLRRLPPGAEILYTGLFPSRGCETVRLCIAGMDREAMLRFLRSIGWPGPMEELSSLTAGMARVREGAMLRDAALLHLDVGTDLPPHIGMEYVFSRREQARATLPENRFLEHLAEHGLCDPGRAAALRDWPGCSVERFDHHLWESLVFRRVNHVKLTVARGRPVQAKAYLTVSHSFRSRRLHAAPSAALAESAGNRVPALQPRGNALRPGRPSTHDFR